MPKQAKMPKDITDAMKLVPPLACGHVPDCISAYNVRGAMRLHWVCQKCKCSFWEYPEVGDQWDRDKFKQDVDANFSWIEEPLHTKILEFFTNQQKEK